MKETRDEMMALQALQKSAAADPMVVSNMGRHMAALNILLLGRRGQEASEGETIIQSGFRMSPGAREMMMAAASRLQNDVVHLAFDVEQAAGAPTGIIVVHVRGKLVDCHPRCALWMPAGVGRAVIVGLDPSQPCHFIVRRGLPLMRMEGWPAPQIEAGQRRGGNVLFKLAASPEMRDAHVGAHLGVLGFDGSDQWSYRADRIAA